MNEYIKISTKLTSSIMLIPLAVVIISCASWPKIGTSKENTSSVAAAEKKGGINKTDNYCEITACIGEIKDECEMRIGVMKNYDATVQADNDDGYILKVDKAISVEFLKDWILKDSLSLNRLGSGDKLFYRKYKEENTEYYARYSSNLLRVMRKIRLDEQAPGYKFTFRQIIHAAEALVQKDKTQLGQETLIVKKRVFQKVPLDPFFISPIKHRELY